jgi:hypothetical protein
MKWCKLSGDTEQLYEFTFMIELSLYVAEREKYVSALCDLATGVPNAYSNFNRSSLCCLTIITVNKDMQESVCGLVCCTEHNVVANFVISV